MFISITNWDKYNPRADVKHTTWLRLENNFWMDPALTPLDSDGKMVWIVLLSLASQQQKGVVEVDSDFVAGLLKIAHEKLEGVIYHLQDRGKLKIHTSRPRNARVTRTSRPRHVHVPLRTDVTNETDGTDGTDCAGASAGAEPSPPTLILEAVHEEPELPPPPAKRKPPGETTPAGRVWLAYAEAYRGRYGQEPVRNAKVNGQCAQLVARLGAAAAVEVVKFYLSHSGRFYVSTLHALGACLKDAEGLHTQWQAGHRVSAVDAVEADRRQSTGQQVARLAEHLEAKFGAKKEGA